MDELTVYVFAPLEGMTIGAECIAGFPFMYLAVDYITSLYNADGFFIVDDTRWSS